ncbi:FHA domain-containing protein FHA2 [Quillaja saponaria]|uniref:FHA domain-containing protein FHA2 n=1 Tax=Quillaja saponaria TaxID=32244 RepID=A0AAD7LP22_QUISA|nr:FHA domain-containing protein FHA2 [Quillaja saponaria]
MGTSANNNVEAGFAKLQGKEFEYYMQTYSIILGRNSKTSTVDLDLSSLGGGMKISRHHAHIFYDFTNHHFALEVLGKNGCLVKGVLHLPSNTPIKLNSQDLIQIGDKQFYFLLPRRGISRGPSGPKHNVGNSYVASARPIIPQYNVATIADTGALEKKGKGKEDCDEEYVAEEDIGGNVGGGNSIGKSLKKESYDEYRYGAVGSSNKATSSSTLG